MLALIIYILKVSIGLSLIYLLYWAFLRHLTFYTWNRWYFLFFSMVVFVLPFIDINILLTNKSSTAVSAISVMPVINIDGPLADIHSSIGLEQQIYTIVTVVFLSGITILVARLLIQVISYWRLQRSADLLIKSPVKIYQVDKTIIPFSFANSIFLNPELHSESELKEIIRHEFIHVKQNHTLDIILSELICILNWYNPFAWMIKKAIRQNLEFIADEQVILNGVDKKHYQYLLLKVIGVPHFSIATNFNFSSLKKRIAMMNKDKSGKIHLLKFLVAIPLIIFVVTAFRKNQDIINEGREQQTDTIPLIPAPPKVNDLPQHVRSIVIRNGNATVKLKDGKTEQYNLDDSADRKLYVEKYGEIPAPPEPPHVEVVAPKPPQVVIPEEYRAFLKRNPSVKNLSWKSDPERVIINFKNGSKEEIPVNDDAAMDKAIAKYGEFPVPPPPPPPPPAAPQPPTPPDPPAKDNTTSSQNDASSSKYSNQESKFTAVVSKVNVDAAQAPASKVQGYTGQREFVAKRTTTAISADLIEFDYDFKYEASDKIEKLFELTGSTTKADLDRLVKELASRGFELKFNDVDYLNNSLTGVTGSITHEKTKSHFTANDFSKVTIEWVKKENGRTGFRIYVHNGSVVI